MNINFGSGCGNTPEAKFAQNPAHVAFAAQSPHQYNQPGHTHFGNANKVMLAGHNTDTVKFSASCCGG